MLVLLNPFLLILYLLDLVRDLEPKQFSRVIIRASLISGVVFVAFTGLGDLVFERVLQAKFASFQVFGGVVFLIIGLRFVFVGNDALHGLRGNPEHLAGAIAMPVMIGPGTIGVSVIAGQRLGTLVGSLSIVLSVVVSAAILIGLKVAYEYVQPRNAGLVERYTEIAGRVAALVVGTFSIEMIFRGVTSWFS